MWTCAACGEHLDDQFESCWKCSTVPEAKADPVAPPKWRVCCRFFESSMDSWSSMFSDAAAFATEIGRDKVINISHSADHHRGCVAVWFWQAQSGYLTDAVEQA